jgi:hypothetical protein
MLESGEKMNNSNGTSWLLVLVLGAGIGGGAWWFTRDSTGTTDTTDTLPADLRSSNPNTEKTGTWTEHSAIRLGKKPTAIAARGETIYVATGKTVFRVDPETQRLSRAGDSTRPILAMTLAEGQLYIATKTKVRRLGNPTLVTLSSPSVITSIAVQGKLLFIADAGRRTVWRYSASGKKHWPIDGEGFDVPSPYFATLIDTAGLLRVVNPGRQRVEAYTTDGLYESPLTWGTSGAALNQFAGCCNPTYLAQLPDGRFVTAEKGLPRVKLWTMSGEFVTLIASAEQFKGPSAIAGLATDGDGRVYVLDAEGECIRVFGEPKP